MPRTRKTYKKSGRSWTRSSRGASLVCENMTGDQRASLFAGFLKGDADRASMLFSSVFRVDPEFARLGGELSELLNEAPDDATLSLITVQTTGEVNPVVVVLKNLGYDDTSAFVNATVGDTAQQDATEATTGLSTSQIADGLSSAMGLASTLLSM